jgi:hypothetical protein
MEKNNMKKTYLISLVDPETKEIRYVGKTVNLKNRIRYHNNPHNTDTNKHKKNWINSLIKKGLKPEVLILEELYCINNEWVIFEQYWISQLRCWGFNLLNYSIGGDNPPIKKPWSKKDRIRLSRERKDKRKIKVFFNNELIGEYIGINEFIRNYFKIDRYENKKEFNQWSSKISSILNGRRKTHKNYKFELVNDNKN